MILRIIQPGQPQTLRLEGIDVDEHTPRPWYKKRGFWIVAGIIFCLYCVGVATVDEQISPVQADTAETVNEEPRPSCSYHDMHPDDYRALTPGLDAELDAEIEAILAEEERKDTAEVIGGGDGSITVGGKSKVEFHYHEAPKQRKRKVQTRHVPVTVNPIMRHEMVIVPSDGQAPVIFKDNCPPRVAVVDAEVARAYAAHMLRMAQVHGTR